MVSSNIGANARSPSSGVLNATRPQATTAPALPTPTLLCDALRVVVRRLAMTPDLWVPPGVKQADHNDRLRVDAKDEPVGKVAKWRAPGLAVEGRIRLGLLTDEPRGGCGRVEEALAELRSLTVIPLAGGGQVGLGRRPNDDGHH